MTRKHPTAPADEEPLLDSYVQDYLQELQLFVCIIIFSLLVPTIPCPPY